MDWVGPTLHGIAVDETMERFSFTLTRAKNRVCAVCIHVTSHFFVPKSIFRCRNDNFHVFHFDDKKITFIHDKYTMILCSGLK